MILTILITIIPSFICGVIVSNLIKKPPEPKLRLLDDEDLL